MNDDDSKHAPADEQKLEWGVSPPPMLEKLSPAQRFLALSQMSTALMSERDEERLLNLIASTARDLTGAAIVAFSLRPVSAWRRVTSCSRWTGANAPDTSTRTGTSSSWTARIAA